MSQIILPTRILLIYDNTLIVYNTDEKCCERISNIGKEDKHFGKYCKYEDIEIRLNSESKTNSKIDKVAESKYDKVAESKYDKVAESKYDKVAESKYDKTIKSKTDKILLEISYFSHDDIDDLCHTYDVDVNDLKVVNTESVNNKRCIKETISKNRHYKSLLSIKTNNRKFTQQMALRNIGLPFLQLTNDKQIWIKQKTNNAFDLKCDFRIGINCFTKSDINKSIINSDKSDMNKSIINSDDKNDIINSDNKNDIVNSDDIKFIDLPDDYDGRASYRYGIDCDFYKNSSLTDSYHCDGNNLESIILYCLYYCINKYYVEVYSITDVKVNDDTSNIKVKVIKKIDIPSFGSADIVSNNYRTIRILPNGNIILQSCDGFIILNGSGIASEADNPVMNKVNVFDLCIKKNCKASSYFIIFDVVVLPSTKEDIIAAVDMLKGINIQCIGHITAILNLIVNYFCY